MAEPYPETIARLIASAPYEIDTDVRMEGRPPSTASSEFLTNREQGAWAERVVLEAINSNSTEFVAVRYGWEDSLAAGDPAFPAFYLKYQEELNQIGKKPDLLIFRRDDLRDPSKFEPGDVSQVKRAIAAIEVRSSTFLANKYAAYMNDRTMTASRECERIRGRILQEPYASTLKNKSPVIHQLIQNATASTYREVDFSFGNNILDSPRAGGRVRGFRSFFERELDEGG